MNYQRGKQLDLPEWRLIPTELQTRLSLGFIIPFEARTLHGTQPAP